MYLNLRCAFDKERLIALVLQHTHARARENSRDSARRSERGKIVPSMNWGQTPRGRSCTLPTNVGSEVVDKKEPPTLVESFHEDLNIELCTPRCNSAAVMDLYFDYLAAPVDILQCRSGEIGHEATLATSEKAWLVGQDRP